MTNAKSGPDARSDFEKTFDPAGAEQEIYDAWERAGAFRPSDAPGAEPFTIVIPPPNVTGSLHMGHALNNTLQDILARFERMRGKSVLWQPGCDHAGIATQMVVERQLMERQEPSRREMGREAFVRRVWEWKEESGGTITRQLRRLGASCDWSRERFTMDEGLSKAVARVFVQLYREGLIYRDKRLVNWDPKFQTAISDLEVENIETDGHFWHFRYPLADGATYEFPVEYDEDGKPTKWETRDYVSVATTRPETMLGDTGVAVHPDDDRYKDLVGRFVELPIVGRRIPIVADEHADPEQGSGAVKITPAHDFNDFEVGKRAGLPAINVMTDDARIALLDNGAFLDGLDPTPARRKVWEALDGKDRFEARKIVVAWFEENGLLDRVEEKKVVQPFGDRSGVVIEPYLTDQWYVDAKKLAEAAIAAVEQGKTRFVPENWTKTYYQWMHNIQPWCVSRQLWWGHQIPAWYGPDGHCFVAESEEEARRAAIARYTAEGYTLEEIDRMVRGEGEGPLLARDPDVLDTWFSSALWPFTTLGWPDAEREGHADHAVLKTRYPTSVLVTAFDIIFFWVARMMMMGLHFMKDVPFRDVYIHALVLDEQGRKMSKSKGNVIDPLALIDKYGADALRFTLAAQAAQGRNIRLAEARVEGYRNFATKLWNAARFCVMNECVAGPGFDPASATATLNKWIVHEANACVGEVSAAFETYRFNDAAGAIYRFTWNVFCDWYLELAKPALQGDDAAAKAETRQVAGWTLERILKLLHPFMPFVTEALWGKTARREGLLMLADWPLEFAELRAPEAAAEINWMIGLITAIRSLRAEMNIPAAARIPLEAASLDDAARARLAAHEGVVRRLARLSVVSLVDAPGQGAAQFVHDGAVFALPLAGVIDVAAEKARLEKEIAKAEEEIARVDKKLANRNFVERAPAAVVEEQKSRRADYAAQRDKLAAALDRLKAL
ncbi:valine--tRNA ligase [Amphiplicatus metriothermophilus]|nr:valine--tRNA ligase [Amphiplicatus metriothermophilus]MBB5519892.1 valyl-tRNA synthetase [Amphiplicatus metriothermophilus]